MPGKSLVRVLLWMAMTCGATGVIVAQTATKPSSTPDAIIFLNPAGHFVIDSQHIVFALFRQNLRGKEKPQKLVVGAIEPEVSPDGKRIAYKCRGTSLAVELCVIDTDGRRPTRIVSAKSGLSVLGLSWSPDSRKLAIASSGKNKTGVYIINDDGSNETKVNGAKAGEVAWSPDGKTIVYSAAADGTDVKQFVSRSVVVTPSGLWYEPLAPRFRQVDLYAVDLGTKVEKRLTRDSNTNMNPAWSPDGQFLAFSSNRDGRYGIYFLEIGTGQAHRFVSAKQWHALRPSWSPDGNTVIFQINETNEERHATLIVLGTEQIMTMTLDGQRSVLGRGSAARFIPPKTP